MDKKQKIVRDFLYVDLDRLYSLYSQVFEGVAHQMVESFTNQASSTDAAKSMPFQGRTLEEQVVELSTRTAVKWLHDYMYNALEDKLAGVLLDNPALTKENFAEVLGGSFLLKVRGSADIEDYQRLTQLMKEFNAIGEAIAYARTLGDDAQQAIKRREAEIASTRDRNKQTAARETLKNRSDPKALAKALGLHQDPTLLNNISLFVRMSNPNAFEITVAQEAGSIVAYRGVLDRKWLRIEPELLRSLYGASIEAPVTMVGHVTHVPSLEQPVAAPNAPPVRASSEDRPSMRDSFRNMFRSGRFIDQFTLESDARIEVVVCPIAIYREKTVGLES